MKLIKPSFEIIEQEIPPQKMSLSDRQYKREFINAMYKHIETCGRTCYKSTDKITEDSAKPFVDRLIAAQHYAMLEHGTIYLKWDLTTEDYSHSLYRKYLSNKYSKVVCPEDDSNCYVTTNYRVIVENKWEEDLQYICAPTKHHKRRYTVKFTCNRQVSHEFVRHRVFSFAQESTRYCNYTKDKFGNELTFIEPCWDYHNLDSRNNTVIMGIEDPVLEEYLQILENTYFEMIKSGWVAQQAATILPNALKTELIMTGFVDDWKHFFDLRVLGTTGKPHPQAEELAKPLMEEFIKRKYI